MKRNTCLIVFGVLLTLMSSCKKGSENPSLYRYMLNGADATVGCNNDIYLIIPVCCNGDSMDCVKNVCSFYYELNIKILEKKEFTIRLYDHIVKNEYIEVDTTCYKYLQYYAKVEEDTVIKSLYDREGIDAVIDEYLDECGILESLENRKEDMNYDYIVYLCFQHNIYFFWDDEINASLMHGWDEYKAKRSQQ